MKFTVSLYHKERTRRQPSALRRTFNPAHTRNHTARTRTRAHTNTHVDTRRYTTTHNHAGKRMGMDTHAPPVQNIATFESGFNFGCLATHSGNSLKISVLGSSAPANVPNSISYVFRVSMTTCTHAHARTHAHAHTHIYILSTGVSVCRNSAVENAEACAHNGAPRHG